MNDKFLSLLGIARRAGKLSSGHDAVKEAVNGKKAELLIFSADASQRLRDEFVQKLSGTKTVVLITDYTMYDIYCATGSKAAVISVNDGGFAKRLTELSNEKHKEV